MDFNRLTLKSQEAIARCRSRITALAAATDTAGAAHYGSRTATLREGVS